MGRRDASDRGEADWRRLEWLRLRVDPVAAEQPRRRLPPDNPGRQRGTYGQVSRRWLSEEPTGLLPPIIPRFFGIRNGYQDFSRVSILPIR